MLKINWNDPTSWFFLGIIILSITGIVLSKIEKKPNKENNVIYQINIHDGDSIIIYKKVKKEH